MSNRFDNIDERIIYHLARDARHTSAPDIAKELDVSAPTIRNRIRRLENEGVLNGYHAHVDYERIGGRLTNLFMCSVNVSDRERAAKRILGISGVINVREVMTGRRDLRVKAVGTNTDDIARIGREISAVGVDIEEEDLIYHEYFHPYTPFGPEETRESRPLAGFMELAGGADVATLSVAEDASIAGKTLQEADTGGLISDDALIVTIERGENIITPKGHTTIQVGDLVTVFSREGLADETLQTFTGGDD